MSASAGPARKIFLALLAWARRLSWQRRGWKAMVPAEMAPSATVCRIPFSTQSTDAGINGDGARRVPNTTNLWFDYIEGEALVIALDLKGLAVSSGAACSSGAIEPSHVLLAMGLSHERARSSVRISLGKQTTNEDIEFAIKVVAGDGRAFARDITAAQVVQK